MSHHDYYHHPQHPIATSTSLPHHVNQSITKSPSMHHISNHGEMVFLMSVCFNVVYPHFYKRRWRLIKHLSKFAVHPAAYVNVQTSRFTFTDLKWMHMTFYFGVMNVPILFKEWTVNTAGEMIGACIGVCIVAMLYEGLKVLRESLLRRSIEYRRVATVDGDGVNLIRNGLTNVSICAPSHWLQTFLHFIQVTVSYALMLIFMTYNGYLAISILIGASLGYFVFGWKKAVIADINEHCH